MKKGWKIALITLGSLVGLVVVVAAVALWLVFTPAQLTKIVNSLAGKYVTCETRFGRVNLTLFKTFPDAGLTIDDVYVVNPMEGAMSDTVAHIGNLTVGVDVKKYLKEKEVVVHQVLLDKVTASLYTDSAGRNNYDIFPKKEKKKDKEKKPFCLDSLPNIDLRRVNISHLDAQLLNEKGRMYTEVTDLDLNVTGTLAEGLVDADLDLQADKMMLKTDDSTGKTKVYTVLDEPSVALKANGNFDRVTGRLKMNLKKGRFNDMVNATLQSSKHDLLKLELPFSADLQSGEWKVESGKLKVDDYALDVSGDVSLKPMTLDVTVATDGAWQVEPLLTIVPEKFVKFKKGMDLDAKVKLQATAVGTLTDSTKPLINATVNLADGRFYYPKSLPYKVNRINGDLSASLDLSKGGKCSAVVERLKAHTRGTDVSVKGRADDLRGDMHIDGHVKGSLPLEDIMPMIPEKLKVTAQGDADLDVTADFKMSQLKAKAYDKMKLDGDIRLKKLDAKYDDIQIQSPDLNIALQLPAKEHAGKMGDAHLTSSKLKVENGKWMADLTNPDINVGINNMMKEQLAAAFEVALGKSAATLDSNQIDLSSLALKGSVRFDSTQSNTLKKYNPQLNIQVRNGVVNTTALPEKVYLNEFAFAYMPKAVQIRNAEIKLGRSDFQLYGTVDNLEEWMDHKEMLTGDLNFTSTYTDVDELMSMFSGKGTDPDTLEQMRQEDKVAKDANPFMVPKDVDVTLHTHIRRSMAFGNDLGDLAGAVTIKDGTAILDQIGFVCKAATMQLTALYRSLRPNNIFVALDFHLLDIQIAELLDMIPTVDTLVPMLAAFNGNANFHLAGEGFLNARYKPKMSTLLGSAAISGKDLVVMDNNSIAQIAKLMQFKEWKDKDNKLRIDSLSVEMTCLRKEIEVFPFLINIGKYQLCASGKHNLVGDCGYHVELLKNPIMAKVGVDVKGSLKNPKITLGEIRYADLYKPQKQGLVEKRALEMKRMVREALEKNVR